MYSVWISQTSREILKQDFGFVDDKGRKIGALATWTTEVYEHATSDLATSDLAPGTYYTMTVHATRDGKPFGAEQLRQYFRSAFTRLGAYNQYLRSAANRAKRKAA